MRNVIVARVVGKLTWTRVRRWSSEILRHMLHACLPSTPDWDLISPGRRMLSQHNRTNPSVTDTNSMNWSIERQDASSSWSGGGLGGEVEPLWQRPLLIRGDLQLTMSTSLTVMPMVFKNTSKMSLQDFTPSVKGTYPSPLLTPFWLMAMQIPLLFVWQLVLC